MSLEAVVLQRLHSKRNAISISNEEGEDNTFHDITYKPIFHYDGGSSHEITHLNTGLSHVNSVSSSCMTPDELSTVSYCTRKRRKRRRSVQNKVSVEEKRKKHIQVERNRRKEMNNKFSLLRSLMPPSYSLRGDQASIVGGAIILVKELEHHLQYLLQSHHNIHQSAITPSSLFSYFITRAAASDKAVADVEVRVAERYATVKVLTRKQPKQLLRVLHELSSAHLTILHLNVTSIDAFVLYSFSLKKEDECKLNTVNEIASAVYSMIKRIQQQPEPEI